MERAGLVIGGAQSSRSRNVHARGLDCDDVKYGSWVMEFSYLEQRDHQSFERRRPLQLNDRLHVRCCVGDGTPYQEQETACYASDRSLVRIDSKSVPYDWHRWTLFNLASLASSSISDPSTSQVKAQVTDPSVNTVVGEGGVGAFPTTTILVCTGNPSGDVEW